MYGSIGPTKGTPPTTYRVSPTMWPVEYDRPKLLFVESYTTEVESPDLKLKDSRVLL